MDPAELRRQRAEHLERAEQMLDAAQTANRDLTDEERTDHDGLMSTIEGLTSQIDRAERVDRIRVAAGNPHNRMSGSSPDAYNARDLVAGRRDPWADRQARPLESDTDIKARALTAIEILPRADDDTKQRMSELVEHPVEGREASAYLLAVSDPNYRSAFVGLLRNPQSHLSWTGPQREAFATVGQTRTAMSLTSANGGYMLPFELDPSIILSNAGATSDVRKVARVIQTTQNVWHGVSSAGVNAEWLGEGSEVGDDSPTVAQPTVTAYKAAAWVQASYEFLEDSNIESDIGVLIADAKDRLEAAAFVNGNGTTQPHGLITVLSGVTASRVAATTNGSFGAVDVIALDNNLSSRWRNNASFLANRAIYNSARLFSTGTGALSGSFWVDFGGGLPPKLLGYNAMVANDMTSSLSAATASNDDVLILGDFRQYVICDRIGTAMVFEPLVKGASFRPTGQVGWFVHWRVGADVLVNDAFRLLRV